jgi:hypothetical protein
MASSGEECARLRQIRRAAVAPAGRAGARQRLADPYPGRTDHSMERREPPHAWAAHAGLHHVRTHRGYPSGQRPNRRGHRRFDGRLLRCYLTFPRCASSATSSSHSHWACRWWHPARGTPRFSPAIHESSSSAAAAGFASSGPSHCPRARLSSQNAVCPRYARDP